MDFGVATFALAFAAGALSTLSPCVVPLLPILVASAVAQHRFGLYALAAGLALSFTAVGLFVATIGVSIGIDSTVLHRVAGALLVVFGAVMALRRLQAAFAAATARLAGGGNALLARTSGRGGAGQFVVGLLLGIVWTPCVGPTLGAASTLAAQGSRLGEVAALMLVFGIGAATPLVVLGSLSRRLGGRVRGRWLVAADVGRRLLGLALVVVGLVIVLGFDKQVESWLVDHSPDVLTELTTQF
ncbi:MAG: cytochrome c biogenesis protein CcdA [Caldimonas sp.]